MTLPRPYYQDSAVTLYHGDCREILPELGKVDHVITDPPYGDTATHEGHLSKVKLRDGGPAGQALGFGGISRVDCLNFAQEWTRIAWRWVVFTCEWKYAHVLDEQALLVRLGIWRKRNGAPQFTGDRPGTGWEAVAVCHRPGKKHWNGGGRHAFWDIPKVQGQTGHPTEKPLELFAAFVQDFTDPGELILDPFTGSGTTLRAAKDLGRRAIGIEIEEKYCEIAAKRMSQEVLPLWGNP